MQTKYKVILSLLIIAVAFATGRYSAPVKVVTETKIVQSDKKTDKEKSSTNEKKHKKITRVETVKPDGTREITTTTTEDDDTATNKSDTSTETTVRLDETKREVVKASNSNLTLSALGGAKVSFSSPFTPVYGGMVSKSLLGPINMGLFGLSDGVCGVALGVTF